MPGPVPGRSHTRTGYCIIPLETIEIWNRLDARKDLDLTSEQSGRGRTPSRAFEPVRRVRQLLGFLLVSGKQSFFSKGHDKLRTELKEPGQDRPKPARRAPNFARFESAI